MTVYNYLKLELISDLFRVKKQLWAFGFIEFQSAVTSPGNEFDRLIDMDFESLEVELAYNYALMSAKARELAGL